MGSGKTTVGKLLSKKLRATFVDSDELIVKKSGLTIPQIFERFGEEGFREMERRIIREVLETPSSPLVLSVGGGAPAFFDNMEVINSLSTSVYLKNSFETLYSRIARDGNRPLAASGEREKLLSLYGRRIPFYERAKIHVNCEGRSPEEIAEEIISRLF